jgi:type IV pilus assembly protein PilC
MYTQTMAEFVCRVADANGRVHAVVEVAPSGTEARQKLADRGLFVYSVRPRAGSVLGLASRSKTSKVSGSDFLIFNQQFNTLIKAGLPILRSLDLLADRAATPGLRPVVSQVRDRVREGKSLSEALELQAVFPKVYTTAILAGEKSGNLPGVLDYYIAYQRITTGVRKRVLATLVYPTILVVVATIIVSYLVTFVIPKFADLYRDMAVPLPTSTRVLVAITVEYRAYVLGLAGLAAAAAVGIFLWSRTAQGGEAFDRLKFRVPLVGDTILKFHVAQFVRTLATLLSGGTPLVGGLQISGDALGSQLLRGAVSQATQMVREGESLHSALGSRGVMPGLALDMIEVGESSGALAPMLNSVAEFYEEEVNLRLSALVSVIEPVILIFMGLLVAFILISLYLPIFSFSISGTGR